MMKTKIEITNVTRAKVPVKFNKANFGSGHSICIPSDELLVSTKIAYINGYLTTIGFTNDAIREIKCLIPIPLFFYLLIKSIFLFMISNDGTYKTCARW